MLRACLNHWELTDICVSNNIIFSFSLFIGMHMFLLTHVSSCLDIVGALPKSCYWNMSIPYFFDCFFQAMKKASRRQQNLMLMQGQRNQGSLLWRLKIGMGQVGKNNWKAREFFKLGSIFFFSILILVDVLCVALIFKGLFLCDPFKFRTLMNKY